MYRFKVLILFSILICEGSLRTLAIQFQCFDNRSPHTIQTDKWGLNPPCFVIAIYATGDQNLAKKEVSRLSSQGNACGYLWIPDYKSLSGNQSYCVYLGPFSSEVSCAGYLEKYKKSNPASYGILIANSDTRIEIRGIGKTTKVNKRYNSVPGIYPQGSMERLNAYDLNQFGLFELKIIKNEILARHGNKFKTTAMIQYFSQQPWYFAKYDDVTSFLSETEKTNIELLANLEKKISSASSSGHSTDQWQELPPPPPQPEDISLESPGEVQIDETESRTKTNVSEVYTVVEEQPSYPGGEEARIRFLQENIKYPEEAKELGIRGKVFVTFVVEIDGSISDIRVLRGIGGGCDEEAIRVVDAMPRWIPGKQSGSPVRVQYNLPIKFSLN